MPITSIKAIDPRKRPPRLEDFNLIFEMVASNVSLQDACKRLSLHYPTVQSRLTESADLIRQYQLARAYRGELLAEKAIETAQDLIDNNRDENGGVEIRAAKTAIETFKWGAAQLDPAKWGQTTVKTEISGPGGKDLNLGPQIVIFQLPDNGR